MQCETATFPRCFLLTRRICRAQVHAAMLEVKRPGMANTAVRTWYRDWNPNGPPLPLLRQYPTHIEPGQFPPVSELQAAQNAQAAALGPRPPGHAPDANGASDQGSMWALLSVLQNGAGPAASPGGRGGGASAGLSALSALTDAASQLTAPPQQGPVDQLALLQAAQQTMPNLGGGAAAAAAEAAAAAAAAAMDEISPPARVHPGPGVQRAGPTLDTLHQMGFLAQICARLEPKDLGRAAQVCRVLREIGHLDSLWALLLWRSYFDAPSNAALHPRDLFLQHSLPRAEVRGYVMPNPDDPCPCGTGEEYQKCCLPQVVPVGSTCKIIEKPKRDASQWDQNHPRLLSKMAGPPPPELADSDPTTFTYREGPLDSGNDVYVADMTLKDALNYCADPALRHTVGFTFCADSPAPQGEIRCYFKWATRKGTQPTDYHPPGKWHTFIRTSKVETERQQLENQRDKQIRLLSAYEMRRVSDILPVLSDSSCPRHSGAFRGRRCPEPGCNVCGGPGAIVSEDLSPMQPVPPVPRSWCSLCNGSLRSAYRPNARCPCITSRGVKLPLKIVTLSQTRAMQGSLADLNGFGEMRETLNEVFELHILDVDKLEPGTLINEEVDVVLLSTTLGPGLDEVELKELRGFVQSGGTAILSAFSNHSTEEHWNASLVGWLGIENPPRAPCTERNEYALDGSQVQAALDECPSTTELLRGPFGTVDRFVNTNETTFVLTQPRPVSGAVGGIMLNASAAAAPPGQLPADGAEAAEAASGAGPRGTLAYFPRAEVSEAERTAQAPCRVSGKAPCPCSQAGVPQGLGQVLVVANYHCLGNSDAWQGGHWVSEPHNRALFLNMMASAVAWRSGKPEAEPSFDIPVENKTVDAAAAAAAVAKQQRDSSALDLAALLSMGGDSGGEMMRTITTVAAPLAQQARPVLPQPPQAVAPTVQHLEAPNASLGSTLSASLDVAAAAAVTATTTTTTTTTTSSGSTEAEDGAV